MTSGTTLERKLSDTKTELPFGWEYSRLGDIVAIKYGKGLPTKNLIESGYPVFGANGVIGFHKEYLYEDEQVLISCRGAYSGKINWSPAKCFVTNNSLVLEVPKGRESIRKYLFYALQSIDKSKLVTGSAQPQVTINNAEVLRVPIASKDQQKRIVAEIEKQFSRLDEAVANLKRVKANLKRYKAAVLKVAVEGKLTEDWRKQHPNIESASELLERILAERRAKWKGRGTYKEPEATNTTGLPPLPKAWTWARLEQLGMVVGGLTKNPKRAKLKEKLPYLRVANVYANELRLDEIEHIGIQDSELDKLLLRKGDLLVVEGNGSKDQIGRLAIWDGSIDPCVHQNHLIKVRLVVGLMNKWVLFWLLSPVGRHFIEEVSSSTSGLYTLSVNKVGDLPIIVPPLAEQEQIIAEVERRLSVIEELEAAVEANLTRADRLRQSILSQAFSGRLNS
jgi:type I restriction enzyme S subunit